MNKKGQALVEFVIILPIFLMLLFIVIDFGKILFSRIELENLSNDVVALYDDGKTKEEIENETEQTTFYLSTKIPIQTPGLNLVLDSPYPVEVKRVVYNGI